MPAVFGTLTKEIVGKAANYLVNGARLVIEGTCHRLCENGAQQLRKQAAMKSWSTVAVVSRAKIQGSLEQGSLHHLVLGHMNFGAVWKVGVFLSIHMLSVSHTWIVELGSDAVFFHNRGPRSAPGPTASGGRRLHRGGAHWCSGILVGKSQLNGDNS